MLLGIALVIAKSTDPEESQYSVNNTSLFTVAPSIDHFAQTSRKN